MAGPVGPGAAPRVHKRVISDQHKRREVALQRQKQGRRDLQHHARQLATAGAALSPPLSPLQHGDYTEESCIAELEVRISFYLIRRIKVSFLSYDVYETSLICM